MLLELVDQRYADEEISSLIEAIEIILNKKEEIVAKIILENTTKLG